MTQSKLYSFYESIANVLIGYSIAVFFQWLVFPWFGVHIPLKDNMLMGGIFTVISIVRSYTLRRFFNSIHTRMHS